MASFFDDIAAQFQGALGNIATTVTSEAQSSAANLASSAIARATNLLPQNIRTNVGANSTGASKESTLTSQPRANLPSAGEQATQSFMSTAPQNVTGSTRSSPLSTSPAGVVQERVRFTGQELMKFAPYAAAGLGIVAVLAAFVFMKR